MRVECAKWLLEQQFDHFVTLNLNHRNDFGMDRSAKVHEFFKRINRKLLTRRWSKRSLGEIEMVAFVEHPDTNVHYHCLLKGTAKHHNFNVVAEQVWRDLVPGGQCHVEVYDNAASGAYYVTKELFNERSYADWMLFPK